MLEAADPSRVSTGASTAIVGRRSSCSGGSEGCGLPGCGLHEPERAHRLLHMLEDARTEILRIGIDAEREPGDDGCTGIALVRRRHGGQAGRDIDPMTEQEAFIGQYVCSVHADAQAHACLVGTGVHRTCARCRFMGRPELDQERVSAFFHQPAAMQGEHGRCNPVEQAPDPAHRFELVIVHESPGLDDIGEHHRAIAVAQIVRSCRRDHAAKIARTSKASPPQLRLRDACTTRRTSSVRAHRAAPEQRRACPSCTVEATREGTGPLIHGGS